MASRTSRMSVLRGRPPRGAGRDVRLDQGPLLVGDVAGVMVRSHTTSTSLGPRLFPLWDSL